MPIELRIESTFTGGNGTLVTMYECEHLTAKTYKLEQDACLVSTGDNTCILLCVHCATHLRGNVLQGWVKDVLREEIVKELLDAFKTANAAPYVASPPFAFDADALHAARQGAVDGIRQALDHREIT